MSALLVAVVLGAGAAGSLLRYLVTRRSAGAPWLVLIVNVAGSLVAGFAMGLASAGVIPAEARLALVTGFAGGLTTFSTFSVETIQLVVSGRTRTAALSVGGNLAIGIGAAAIGWLLGSLA